MLRITIEAEDVARTRFACSALHETMASLRVLADPSAHVMQLPWLRDALPRLRGHDLTLLRSLVPSRGYVPDFVTPPPDTPLPDFDSELRRVQAVDAERVRAELVIAFEGEPPAVVREGFSDPAAGVRRLVDELRTYHGLTLRHWWPAILAMLHADIHHRARRLTDGGVRTLFEDLHPAIRWRAPRRLTVENVYDASFALSGRGLLLMPSAFTWPSVGATTDPPWQPTLIYPARGIAAVWDTSSSPVPTAVAGVLGATRAHLLVALDVPHTARALRDTVGLSAGALSQQLTLLRDAGLVTTHRDGRHLICRRTPLAERLLAGDQAP